jgi:hypothetical protein
MERLLSFPQPEQGEWPDYASLGITPQDEEALIEVARVDDATWDESRKWARVHARRCLGQLRATAAAEPLLLPRRFALGREHTGPMPRWA